MVEYYQRRSKNEPFLQTSKPYAGSSVWLNMTGRRPDVQFLAKEYGLDENILRDSLDRHELPRVEAVDGNLYVFLRLPVDKSNTLATAPVLAIAQPSSFISVSVFSDLSPIDIDVFLTTKSDRTIDFLIATMAYAIYQFESKIHQLEEKITNARRRLSTHDVKNADFVEFVSIDDNLNEYRSTLEGLLNVTKKLQENRQKLFKPSDFDAIEDIQLHVQQLLVSISARSQTIDSIQNAYSTVANNKLNERMKLLTAITIFLAIPNVFYGMYGMNVNLPFQHEPWAYPAMVGFTVLLILLIYLLARRFRLF